MGSLYGFVSTVLKTIDPVFGGRNPTTISMSAFSEPLAPVRTVIVLAFSSKSGYLMSFTGTSANKTNHCLVYY